MFKGFIFDLDGTVYLGERLIPGADRVIRLLREAGRKVVFLSNKPLYTREDYAAKLTRLGIPTAPAEVVNSTFVLIRYLGKSAPGREGLRHGGAPLRGGDGPGRFPPDRGSRRDRVRRRRLRPDLRLPEVQHRLPGHQEGGPLHRHQPRPDLPRGRRGASRLRRDHRRPRGGDPQEGGGRSWENPRRSPSRWPWR